MADLEFSGAVDFSEANASLDAFASDAQSRINDALDISSFASTLSAAAADAFSTPIPVEADASAIPAEVDSALAGTSAVLVVDADTTPAASAASDLVGAIDAEAASITVDADTTNAQSALDELSSSADSADTSLRVAGGGAEHLGLSTGQLAGVAGLAVGEVGSLREASSLLGERTAAATAGVLGLGVGITELYRAGLTAVSAEERFTTALGDQAAAIQRVQVGSLDADLFKLGTTFGSADAAMRNATTSVFQFAVNSGASRQQAVQFADGIAAISARAVATKPSVGDIADVMDRAAIGIGRARTAASLLNVGLSTTEVNTRAAAIAQQNGEASASAYDKSLAALQITVERFGPSLKQNITDGAQNAANQAKAAKAEFDNALESFGKPLVAPALDLIRGAIPVAEDLGKGLADVATVAIPLLTGSLHVLGPVIEPVLVTLLAFKAVQIGSEVAVALLQQASAWGILGAEAATSAAEQGLAIYSTEVSLATLSSVAIPAAITGFAAFEGTTLVLHRLFDSIDALTPAFEAETAAAKETAKATGGDLVAAFDRLQVKVEEVRRITGQSATPDAGFFDFKPKVDAASAATENLEVRLHAFRDVAQLSIPAAAALADQYDKNSVVGAAFARVLAEVSGKQHEAKVATDDLASSTTGQNLLNATAYKSLQDYAAGSGSATQALKDLSAAQKEENDQVTLYKNNLLALQGVQGDVTAANVAFKNSQQNILDALTKNGVQFDINTQAGRDNITALQGAVTAADSLAEATYKSELATKGETQARADADGVLSNFRGSLTATLLSLGLNTQQVADLEMQLGLLQSPPPINIFLTTNAEAIVSEINSALGKLDIPGYATFNPFDTSGGQSNPYSFLPGLLGQLFPRASGGPVEAGVPYLVNEDTPRSEIFVPRAPGTIYTQQQWAAGAGGGMGGADYSVHVGQVVAPSPEDVPRAIARKQRAMQFLAGR